MFNPYRPVSGLVKFVLVVGVLLIGGVLVAGALSLRQLLGVLF